MHNSVDTACKEGRCQAFCLSDNPPLCENGKPKVRRRISPAAALAAPRPRTRSATLAIFNSTSLLLGHSRSQVRSLTGIRGWFAFSPPSPPLWTSPTLSLAPDLTSSQFRPWFQPTEPEAGVSLQKPLFHFTEFSFSSSTVVCNIGHSCFSGSQLTTDLSVAAFIRKV